MIHLAQDMAQLRDFVNRLPNTGDFFISLANINFARTTRHYGVRYGYDEEKLLLHVRMNSTKSILMGPFKFKGT